MIYSININTLKAAQFCSATKDVRYYLNSVYLDFKIDTVTPHVNIIATDGHVLAAYNDKLPVENRGDDGADFALIVPLDTIKAVLKMVGKYQKTISVRLGHTATAKNKGFMSYGPTKNDSAVLHNGDNLSVVVVMPMKNAENVYYGFTV